MNELKKHKRKDFFKWILTFLCFIILGVAVSAVLTQGFKTVNPYGWLENFDRMKKGQEITGFEVCKDFEVDFAKLIKNVEAVEDKEAGTKTYALVKTDNENVYVNVVETIADKKSSYSLNVNGQSVCTSADGFNDSAIEAIKSFDACKITEVKNAGRLAHYIGGTYTKTEEAVAKATAKYEVMRAGQTISGFEWNFANGVDIQELIKGIESADSDGGGIYYLVKTNNDNFFVSVQIGTVDGEVISLVTLGSACVWSSNGSYLTSDSDLAVFRSFGLDLTVTEVYNAEILAKYVGAKS